MYIIQIKPMTNNLKIIFLDIDGVLNVTHQGRDEYGSTFHQHLVDNLKQIIDETGAKIVISSTWRTSGLVAMQEMWKFRNLPGEVIDVTPGLYLTKKGGIIFWNNLLEEYDINSSHSLPRGCEIDYWIGNCSQLFGKLTSYVILDDDTDMLLEQKNNYVQCSDNPEHEDCIDIGYGLTKLNVLKAIKILNKI